MGLEILVVKFDHDIEQQKVMRSIAYSEISTADKVGKEIKAQSQAVSPSNPLAPHPILSPPPLRSTPSLLVQVPYTPLALPPQGTDI